MSERDPRVDPRPGDVVCHSDRRRRAVSHVEYDLVSGEHFDARGFSLFDCWITTWRDWARGGEVITRGEP